MAALSYLPNEILSLVTSHLDTPRDVINLSLVSRRLSVFVQLDGWKAFLKGRFGRIGSDTDARNSVHGLTTLHRNWTRKGFIARYLEPKSSSIDLNTWKPELWLSSRRGRSTMGYTPSIDSYEELLGSWTERREVLAWSAGTDIVLRVKEIGEAVAKLSPVEADANQNSTSSYDDFKHLNSWFYYSLPDGSDGTDDISSLKLLRPHQHSMDEENIIFGTASGQLSLLSICEGQKMTALQHFDTSDRTVGSISLSESAKPTLAAALGDNTLAVYSSVPLTSDDDVAPLAETDTSLSTARHGRIWSCNFLSDDVVALGMGPSTEPIQIYNIDRLDIGAIRTFNPEPLSVANSVYPILPLSGAGKGITFLSGSYDGNIRLHDMRSPRNYEALFSDPTNNSSVYSLATHGLDRVVAGVSMHSMIKVFDLRFAGSRPYDIASLTRQTATPKRSHVIKSKVSQETIAGGWNVYLNPRVAPNRHVYREDHWRNRSNSPVYSLSIPSSNSHTIYAGLEGAVESITFHSIADPYPDPTFSHSIKRFPDTGIVDPKSSFNSSDTALDLGMYEQGTEEGIGMNLLIQDSISVKVIKDQGRKEAAQARNVDERFRDPRDDKDRWERGAAVPSTPTRGRGRGGRGRGRSHRGHGG